MSNLQGGHEVLHLASGRVITRPKNWVVMTEMVIWRVEGMVKEQGLKDMKFSNIRHDLLTANDLLKEVGGEVHRIKISSSITMMMNMRLTYLVQIQRKMMTSLANCWILS